MISSPMVDVGDFEQVETVRADAGLAEGNDCNREQGAGQRDDGRKQIQRAVDAGGDDVFLEEILCPVHQRLQQAEGSHAARPQRFWMRPTSLRSSSTV